MTTLSLQIEFSRRREKLDGYHLSVQAAHPRILKGSQSVSRQAMKNIHEVLKQKEADIERLKGELQALRVVAPLLQEEPATAANGGGVATATEIIWSP
jgi:hypothetical protein